MTVLSVSFNLALYNINNILAAHFSEVFFTMLYASVFQTFCRVPLLESINKHEFSHPFSRKCRVSRWYVSKL